MASTWNLSKGLAAVVTASAAAFGLCPSAAADPATPQPNPTQQLPGLPALSQLSPIIQQAASNPAQATQLLMAAAQAFTHNPTAPTESKNVAASVNQFVQEPATEPGTPASRADADPPAHAGAARAAGGHRARRAGAPADRHRPGPRGGSRARVAPPAAPPAATSPAAAAPATGAPSRRPCAPRRAGTRSGGCADSRTRRRPRRGSGFRP